MRLAPEWIADARAAMKKTHVPASVSIAQFGIESGWGKAIKGNNPFGIKHMSGFPDQIFHTHEEIHGKSVPEDLVFAVFPSITEAFMAHAQLIATRPQYAPAMRALPNIEAFVRALAPVYATDHKYADTMLAVIRSGNLTQYDKD